MIVISIIMRAVDRGALTICGSWLGSHGLSFRVTLHWHNAGRYRPHCSQKAGTAPAFFQPQIEASSSPSGFRFKLPGTQPQGPNWPWALYGPIRSTFDLCFSPSAPIIGLPFSRAPLSGLSICLGVGQTESTSDSSAKSKWVRWRKKQPAPPPPKKINITWEGLMDGCLNFPGKPEGHPFFP